jgi:D-amino-acid dehydrogenase
MKSVIIIGGGIVGLSSAYYLRLSGCDVTVIDKNDFLDNCSYGNAGYVCPSHFIPLATPGIVRQGLKWMFNSTSPFYVQPRLNYALLEWGFRFIQSAHAEKVEKAAIPLRDISLLSQNEYESWGKIPGFELSYEHKGLMEIFQTQEKADHAMHTVHKAHELGLDAKLLSIEELQKMEPQTRINGLGAIYFGCDAHLYPNRMMKSLLEALRKMGVGFVPHEEVIGFEKSRGLVDKVN